MVNHLFSVRTDATDGKAIWWACLPMHAQLEFTKRKYILPMVNNLFRRYACESIGHIWKYYSSTVYNEVHLLRYLTTLYIVFTPQLGPFNMAACLKTWRTSGFNFYWRFLLRCPIADIRRFSSPRTKLLAARCEWLHLIKINSLAALWLDERAHASLAGLALVSICEIDVTSFSEDGRGVKWLCNLPKPFPYSNP
jgi:hypothetical protein